ncbi:hypothetical protein CEUSTIGMA_g10753.t1 [Chlamydomonas eustigma]|uniref:Ribonucleoside-diphosphate reductase n=1 Tax=Chlamydomonas eustigma TaxID=1157962 RepID=A0A250XJS5_9CHLO|nr:hypothetical protein CEUSTIGMA_g10753.t1 [Chlamydomonas eustigma]|eukprot:GAX83327.1 hypothetical protein CEUSTIGMA_g10753.t1 [Chlamydomonas eustigma]
MDPNGTVLADCDLFLTPLMSAIWPELALSIVDYRFRNLDAYERLAESFGREGAYVASDSTIEDDFTAYPELKMYRTCVSMTAAWSTYRALRNVDWLRNKGYALMSSFASYLRPEVHVKPCGSLATFKSVGIACVESIEDSSLANRCLTLAMRSACETSYELGLEADESWVLIANALKVSRDEQDTPRFDLIPCRQAAPVLEPLLLSVPYYEDCLDPVDPVQNLEKWGDRKRSLRCSSAVNDCLIATVSGRAAQVYEEYVQRFEEEFEKLVRDLTVGPWGVIRDMDLNLCDWKYASDMEQRIRQCKWKGIADNKQRTASVKLGLSLKELRSEDLIISFFPMHVKKRNGSLEAVSFDKVLARISNLSKDLRVNVYDIAQKVCSRIYDGVNTSELDELAAQMCSSMVLDAPDYGRLASRLIVSNHHKLTPDTFAACCERLGSLLSTEVHDVVSRFHQRLQQCICYDRDFEFDYFGFKTLEKAYLMRLDGIIIERPQHLFMRVSIGIHGHDIDRVIETYQLMSLRYFVHATPTLFNAGCAHNQNSSCYLLGIESDSIEGIFNTVQECAQISKYAGGIGMHIHNVRGKGSRIRGTNGNSSGIVPMLRTFNATARYVNQAGRRNGSIAVFLEPWHVDVMEFLELRLNFGREDERTRDLFMCMWVPDLFMHRVRENSNWTLMCPDECPGLADVHGSEFDKLYTTYEAEGRGRKKVSAVQLWLKVLESQMETGIPYIGYKDAVNRKNNQMNLGTIKSSNLCMEIMEFSSPEEIAVCNLASVCLPTFVTDSKFDFQELHRVVKIVTRNLDRIIDVNKYPLEKARRSNMRHRPIGIGVQGLADAFFLLRIPFESPKAARINLEIFETMYHAALEASIEIAEEHEASGLHNMFESRAGPYESFVGSPANKGVLQFDMWGEQPTTRYDDWELLRSRLKNGAGMRNSLLIAPMPTASTSQIMGFNECFEPITSNMYTRQTLAGDFVIVNRHLVKDLENLKLWSPEMKHKIMAGNGSVQNIKEIPEDIKELYKTAWEIKQKTLIDMAAERGRYVCQSQSMNLFMEAPEFSKLSSMHFYAWSKGLKTGIYYLRSRAKARAQQFTVEPVCQRGCESCSA